MAPYEPKRALAAGVSTALPFAVAAGIMLVIGGDVSAYAFFVLIAMAFVIGLVTAFFLHAVGAILLTGLISIVVTAAMLGIVGGLENMTALWFLATPLFAGDIVGAVVGLLFRWYVRKLFEA